MAPLLDTYETATELMLFKETGGDAIRVRNTGAYNAINCLLDIDLPDGVDVVFSENNFCLAPHEERRVKITVLYSGSPEWEIDYNNIICKAWNTKYAKISN